MRSTFVNDSVLMGVCIEFFKSECTIQRTARTNQRNSTSPVLYCISSECENGCSNNDGLPNHQRAKNARLPSWKKGSEGLWSGVDDG